MNRRYLIAGGAVIALVGVLGVTSLLVGLNPLSPATDTNEQKPPALLTFESTGAQCADDFIANSSTWVTGGEPNTVITHARNVSLPGPSYAIGDPSFDRHNASTYVLSIPIEATAKKPRECAGVARYKATMRIPAGDDPWRIGINHDNETVTTLFGDSDSSGAGGSVSSGGSVSE